MFILLSTSALHISNHATSNVCLFLWFPIVACFEENCADGWTSIIFQLLPNWIFIFVKNNYCVCWQVVIKLQTIFGFLFVVPNGTKWFEWGIFDQDTYMLLLALDCVSLISERDHVDFKSKVNLLANIMCQVDWQRK